MLELAVRTDSAAIWPTGLFNERWQCPTGGAGVTGVDNKDRRLCLPKAGIV